MAITQDLPLLVISHNNHHYVENTISQARQFGLRVIIVDNASSYTASRAFLKKAEEVSQVIYLAENLGHLCWTTPMIYDALPERFFLSDPDLQWSPRLPSDFSDVLQKLGSDLGASRIGFALDLSDSSEMFQDGDYFRGQTITNWEAQFWTTRIPCSSYDLYRAPIDTTFQLFDKAHPHGPQVRVAGDFTAKHLPWYRDTKVPPHDLLHMYVASRGSTISRLVLRQMARRTLVNSAIDECEHVCGDVSFLASAKQIARTLE